MVAAARSSTVLTVRAPFDGIVLKTISNRKIRFRRRWRAGALYVGHRPVAVELAVDIPEAQLGHVHVGDPSGSACRLFPERRLSRNPDRARFWPKKETQRQHRNIMLLSRYHLGGQSRMAPCVRA